MRDEIDPLMADEVSLFLQTVLKSKYYRDCYPVLLCAIHNIVHGRVNLPKNGKARRVDMPDAISEALQELNKARKEDWLAKGQNEIPVWVFCNFEGRLLDTNNLRNRALHKCLEAAKLRTIRLHDLRHAFASLLIQNGESLAYVKDQMGIHPSRLPWIFTGIWSQGSSGESVADCSRVPKRQGKKNLA